MQVAKWGNSLAVRLPKRMVNRLGLKPGDDVELTADAPGTLKLTRTPSKIELLKGLRGLRKPLPKGYRFNREEAQGRGRV